MGKGASHRFGTRVTGGLDVQALRGGLASPGLDTRYWCGRGTVATVDDSGEVNHSDPHAVLISPEGVECDVILYPLDQRVTAVWAGGMAGDCSDISPIHPGDEVLVECPDGELVMPVITAILHSRSNKQPMTAGKPIFDNKRRLIYMAKGDLDIRVASGKAEIAAGGTTVQVNQNEVLLGSGSASHPSTQADNLQSAANTLADAIGDFATSLSSNFVITNPSGATSALTALKLAVTMFKAASYAADNVKTT